MAQLKSGSTVSNNVIIHAGNINTLNGMPLYGTGDISLPTSNNATFTGNTTFTSIISSNAATFTGEVTISSLSQNGVVLGGGTNPLVAVEPGTAGNVLTSSGSSWVSAAPTGGGGSANSATIHDENSASGTYYVTTSLTNGGSLADIYVSSTKMYFDPSTGTLNSTIFNTLSDQSEKENIQIISNALNVVNDLQGVTFDWKSNGLKSSGIIAQELEKILPFLVTSNADGVKSVNYNGIIGYLIEAVKDLSKELEILKNK